PPDQRGGGGAQVGGDQGQRGDRVAGQDHPDGADIQAAVPQAPVLGQVLGGVPAVDVHDSRGPGRGGGQVRRGAQPGSLARAPAGLRTGGGASANSAAFLGSRVVQVTAAGRSRSAGPW